MTKVIWTRDDFIIEENEKVCKLSDLGEKKLSKTQTLVIPEGITSIERNAFQEKDIKKLVLPTSLVSIYDAAFWNCRIREIEGGENVEILDVSALACNILSDISNFKNVRCINRAAFSRNKITNFKAPKTLEFIGESAFGDNGILICDLREAENLVISQRAFVNNGMEELYLGKNAKIEENAFYLNDIKTITGSESAKLDYKAFQGAERKTYKKNFEVLPDNSWTEEDFKIHNNKILCLSESGRMKLDASGHITIPHIEGVDTIDRGALQEFNMKTVYISDGYTTIGAYAFYATEMEYIRLPQDLKRIEESAFEYSKLKYVKVPKTVTSIDEHAFSRSNLIKADLSHSKIKILRNYIFGGCCYLREVLLPKSLTKINDSAFDKTFALKNLEIPEKVKEIERYAFSESGIRTIHFKNNLNPMKIGERAFLNSKLTKIVDEDLEFSSIGTSAFENTFLEEFKAEHIDKIMYAAFKFSPLNLVEIKDVSSIDIEAFRNNGIKKVKLGRVNKIDRETFSLNLIEDLEFFDDYSINEIKEGAFLKNNLKKIHLGEHVEKVSQFAFFGNPIEEFEISEETEIQMLEF